MALFQYKKSDGRGASITLEKGEKQGDYNVTHIAGTIPFSTRVDSTLYPITS